MMAIAIHIQLLILQIEYCIRHFTYFENGQKRAIMNNLKKQLVIISDYNRSVIAEGSRL